MYSYRVLARMIGLSSILISATAHACPVCDTFTGQRVRAGIWDEHFWHNFLLTVSPFAVFAVIIVLLHRGVPFTRRAKHLAGAGARLNDSSSNSATIRAAAQKAALV